MALARSDRVSESRESLLLTKLFAETFRSSSVEITDLNGNVVSEEQGDDWLLLIKMDECKACARMHAAFLHISPPIPVVVISVRSQQAMSMIINNFRLIEVPTLIYFSAGKEIRRWGGFFDDELMIAANKLAHILTEAVQSSRGSHV